MSDKTRDAPAKLFALRKPNGKWYGSDWVHQSEANQVSLHQIDAYATRDQAFAFRHYEGQPDDEIVPLVETMDEQSRLAVENYMQPRRTQRPNGRAAFVERLLLVLAFLAAAGLGYWVAYLSHVEAAFEHGRAEAAIELRHVAELNASESGRIAAEKDAWQTKAKLIITGYLERAHAELLGIRMEDADQVAGEPFLAMRIAGELLRESGLTNDETAAYYQSVRGDVIREITQYLYPETDVSTTLISLADAKDGNNEYHGRPDQ